MSASLRLRSSHLSSSHGVFRCVQSSRFLVEVTGADFILLQYSFIDVLNKKAQTFFAITKLKSTMLQVA